MEKLVRYKIRRSTSSEWKAANPVLAEAELGYDTTLKLLKVGDGQTRWSDLDWLKGEGEGKVLSVVVSTKGEDNSGYITLTNSSGDIVESSTDALDNRYALKQEVTTATHSPAMTIKGNDTDSDSETKNLSVSQLVELLGGTTSGTLAKGDDPRLVDALTSDEVINNLISTAKNQPLSANQGRILNTSINELDSKLTSSVNSINTKISNTETSLNESIGNTNTSVLSLTQKVSEDIESVNSSISNLDTKYAGEVASLQSSLDDKISKTSELGQTVNSDLTLALSKKLSVTDIAGVVKTAISHDENLNVGNVNSKLKLHTDYNSGDNRIKVKTKNESSNIVEKTLAYTDDVFTGVLYDDVTTDYSHINLSIKAPFIAPTQYFDGMVVSFLPKGNNLENATINVNGLGEVQVRAKLDEEGILADKIVLNEYIQLVYNSQINSFVIFSTSNNINNTVPLTCPIYSPNMFEDSNYLLSDNQWHSGEIYKAVWNLLTTQYNDENSVEITKTLSDGTSLTLKKTPLDYLICKIDENNTEEKINRLYNEIRFTCWVINTTTNEFKLPQNTKRELVESWKDENGNWYNLYNDGWIEQGGHFDKGSIQADTTNVITMLKPYKDINYTLVALASRNNNDDGSINNQVFVNYRTTSNFKARCYGDGGSQYIDWIAKGYANTSALNNQFNFSNYLYFKVGNTTVGAELIYANKVLTELDKKANTSGDNVKFDNLSNTAKDNITNIVGWQKIGEFEIDNVVEIEFTKIRDGYQHKFEFINLTVTDNSYMMAVLGNASGYVNSGYSGCLSGRWSQQAGSQWLTDSVAFENSNNLMITSNHNDYWSLSFSKNSYVNFEIKSNLGLGGDQFFEFNSMVNSPVQDGRLMITNGNGMLVTGIVLDRIKFFLSIGSFINGTVKHYIMK